MKRIDWRYCTGARPAVGVDRDSLSYRLWWLMRVYVAADRDMRRMAA